MKLTVPLYVETWKAAGSKATQYTVRPLFHEVPRRHGELLGKAIEQTVSDLQKLLRKLGHAGEHGNVADYAFAPEVEQHRCKLDIEYDGVIFRFAAAVGVFRRDETRIAFFPSLPEEWFELRRGDDVEVRTRLVVAELLKRWARQGDEPRELLELLSLRGKWSVTTVDFQCEIGQQLGKPKESLFARLGMFDQMDGATELERTGRCLDRLYPDRLYEALHRDREIDELQRLVMHPDRRPVLIVGPRRAGKTAILHSVVRRLVAARQNQFDQVENTWLLSPQRLISGMSYVGQWETRLRAILQYAQAKHHTLYFDDLVGTFRAGISRDSDLSVAQLLKPCLEQRNVRIVGEITPEAFRVLREKDRAFADAFQILRIEETTPETTLRIGLALIRRLEQSHECEFTLPVLPESLDLCRRMRSGSAFPGSLADVLKRLAAKHRFGKVQRAGVLDDFEASSGFNRRFLDRTIPLTRDEIVTGLSQSLVGQHEAISALADVLCLMRAGLQDPRRPPGSLLFLGPTGVGKTQCAKALARYLFGSAERLLRFDMNEFVSPQAASRLIGTFDQPEGVLTRAVLRTPFSVLLFDEIEKAHPDVFDLLLQVLGEGRLTDARGRTVDFKNTIVILTSNLGSREAAGAIGFPREADQRSTIYLKAVREFFRPEFVNRLDHIVPFQSLSPSEVLDVARSILRDLCLRDGFVRRKCLVHLPEDVLARVVQEGFDSAWGARGVRRALERRLIRPAAAGLAASVPTDPTVLTFVEGPSGPVAKVHVLEEVSRDGHCAGAAGFPDLTRLLTAVDMVLDRLEAAWTPFRLRGAIDISRLSPEQAASLTHWSLLEGLRANVRQLRDRRGEDLESRLSAEQGRAVGSVSPQAARQGRKKLLKLASGTGRGFLRSISTAGDIRDYLATLTEHSTWATDSLWQPTELSSEALVGWVCLLASMAPPEGTLHYQRAVVVVRTIPEDMEFRLRIVRRLHASFSFSRGDSKDAEAESVGLECLSSDDKSAPMQADPVWTSTLRARLERAQVSLLHFEGPAALRLLATEAGTHLQFRADGSMVVCVVEVMPVDREEGLVEALSRILSGLGPVVQSVPPVVRIYQEHGLTADLRTGLAEPAARDEGQGPAMIVISSQPLPPELRDLQ